VRPPNPAGKGEYGPAPAGATHERMASIGVIVERPDLGANVAQYEDRGTCFVFTPLRSECSHPRDVAAVGAGRSRQRAAVGRLSRR
jgi:hypothetical protein